jgi:hypothetical protein
MKLRLIRQQDFTAGLFFLITGALFAYGSLAYKLGSAMRMGPGYFPLALGLLLALIGLVIAARNARVELDQDEASLIEKPCLRSLLLIGVAMLIFAFALQILGLIIATVALVVISGIAYRSFCWKEISALSTGLAAFASIVFSWALGLPLQVFPA